MYCVSFYNGGKYYFLTKEEISRFKKCLYVDIFEVDYKKNSKSYYDAIQHNNWYENYPEYFREYVLKIIDKENYQRDLRETYFIPTFD